MKWLLMSCHMYPVRLCCGPDNEVSGIPTGQALIRRVHVGGLHDLVLEVEDASWGSILLSDAPYGAGIGRVRCLDGVDGRAGTFVDGNTTRVDFQFVFVDGESVSTRDDLLDCPSTITRRSSAPVLGVAVGQTDGVGVSALHVGDAHA